MKTWFPKRLILLKKNFMLCIGATSRTGVPSFEFLVMLIGIWKWSQKEAQGQTSCAAQKQPESESWKGRKGKAIALELDHHVPPWRQQAAVWEEGVKVVEKT